MEPFDLVEQNVGLCTEFFDNCFVENLNNSYLSLSCFYLALKNYYFRLSYLLKYRNLNAAQKVSKYLEKIVKNEDTSKTKL